MIRAGVYGGSGYMGGEVLRILLEHPQVSIAWATSRGEDDVVAVHPNLLRGDLRFVSPEAITPCDVAFVAAPTGVAMAVTGALRAQGTKVIDLGSDFRLRDRATWERVYGRAHNAWELAERAVYGIPELHRAAIRSADLIANPGCYASAAILGLAPLIREGLIQLEHIAITGLSGTAGIGAEQSRPSHHPEIANNLIPYNVVDHRHSYEIEQELAALAGAAVSVDFTPVYVPISRGILDVCHAVPTRGIRRTELIALYRDFYRQEYFVNVHDAKAHAGDTWNYRPYPWVNSVSGTNFCQIGLELDERRQRIVVFSVLDSMGKGGAHAGVQNMNLLFGLDETTGLKRLGFHPY